jgi:hypothetical protein
MRPAIWASAIAGRTVVKTAAITFAAAMNDVSVMT